MTNIKKLIVGTVMCGVVASFSMPAFAKSVPVSNGQDGRIKSVTYMEDDVVAIKGYYGFQTAIKFEDGEKIENISIGDSKAFQVAPNNAKNILFLKPVAKDATTNMTIVSDKRIYNFELTSGFAASASSPEITYFLRFDYPSSSVIDFNNTVSAPVEYTASTNLIASNAEGSVPLLKRKEPFVGNRSEDTQDLNFEYGFKGDKHLAPATVFDDGTFTYFKFPEGTDLPAVFAVNEENEDSIINMHKDGQYFVVEKLERQFRLRFGEEEACIFNNAYPITVTMFGEANK